MSNVPQDVIDWQNTRMDLAQTMREAATLDDAFRALNQFIENRDQRAGSEAADIPVESIGKVLAEVMDLAVANGANSVSMPDHYVEIAAWLSGVKPDTKPTLDYAAGMMKAAEICLAETRGTSETWAQSASHCRQRILAAIPKESADARVPFGYIKPDPKWGETGHTGMAIFSEKVDDHVVPVYL
jgi:hypothetical protein